MILTIHIIGILTTICLWFVLLWLFIKVKKDEKLNLKHKSSFSCIAIKWLFLAHNGLIAFLIYFYLNLH